MPIMITKKCACCGKSITVRMADHKRGWGKFCSKSCKATKQEASRPKLKRRAVRTSRIYTYDEYLKYDGPFGSE